MLYHIVDPNQFDNCRDAVMYAYWPEEAYLNHKWELPLHWKSPLSDSEKIKRLEELLSTPEEDGDGIVETVSNEPLHRLKGDPSSPVVFPFLGRFHRLFLKRKWTQPYDEPQKQAQELFRLQPKANGVGNYSAELYNFNHFVNVVSALARLIMYFKEVHHVCHVFEERDAKYTQLVFDDAPSMRTFKLMLGGFYHDIGKTVANPRHAMEGAIILGYHTTSARYQLHQIVRAYRDDFCFEREDLLYVAALVQYHDTFGTLGTGEDGFMALVSLIDHFKRYSLKQARDVQKHMKWTHRYLFDLWLLNIADIMVSTNDKWSLQQEWTETKKAQDRIEEFFASEDAYRRIHDLKVTFNLLDVFGGKTDSDDLTALEAEAHRCAKRHVVDRLRRLITSALMTPVDSILAKCSRSQPKNRAETERKEILNELRNLKKEDWEPIIVRAIEAVSDRDDFITRLSWIGKMDYSPGFFQRLAEDALKKICEELEGSEPGIDSLKKVLQEFNDNGAESSLETVLQQICKTRTGWLRDSKAGIQDESYYYKVQALFIADNLVATVIGILAYVLFRESSIDQLRNIEFSDARSRLTSHKVEQLLSLEGPFRTRRAAEAIMQTIYFY